MVRTVPLTSLYKFIFPNEKTPAFDPTKRTILVNIATSEPVITHGLSWMFSHGHSFIHKISFPNNYSEVSYSKYCKICVECILKENTRLSTLKVDVLKFLRETSVINDPSKIVLTDIVDAPGVFPNLSMQNVNGMQFIRNMVVEKYIKNLTNVGILWQGYMFFQFDLIKNSYEKLIAIS